MKTENFIIILSTLSLLAFAILGIENPLYSWHRPMFAITMDLSVICVIIGYIIGYSKNKKYEQYEIKRKIILNFLEKKGDDE